MTNTVRIVLGFVFIASLGACGKDVEMTCDDVRAYQLAVEGKKVVAPAGLDDLDPLKEVPLPEASPRQERPAGSACIDRPPGVRLEDS